MFDEYDEIMSVQEVADAIFCGKNTIYKLIKDHQLSCLRIGKVYKIRRESLEEYMEMEIVWHICSTVGSPKHCPRIPVTLTMISPEVRMVCMEPSYAFFSASALSNFLRFSR